MFEGTSNLVKRHKELLAMHERRLHQLRLKAAQQGVDAPAAVQLEIEDVEQQIELLLAEIGHSYINALKESGEVPPAARRLTRFSLLAMDLDRLAERIRNDLDIFALDPRKVRQHHHPHLPTRLRSAIRSTDGGRHQRRGSGGLRQPRLARPPSVLRKDDA